MAEEYDKVTRASLNGIYVKAQELDRGQNEYEAPPFLPGPGMDRDAFAHASTHASAHASDGDSDAEAHASTHASSGDEE